jgi:NAD(P)H-nitrite reductase large subunit
MQIVIIGNGITGITCARNIRKRDTSAEITVISSESEHFFSRTALMYIYMGHMKYEHTKPYEDWFWEKNRIKLIKGHVIRVSTESKVIICDDGNTLQYDKLVIASGSKPNKFNWPGQNSHGVQGLYSLQDLHSMESQTQGISDAVIIGGGLIGIEMAEMLLSRQIKVHFLVREKYYWSNVLPEEEAQLISRHIREHHISLRLDTELKEIIADSDGKVHGVITQSGESIPCQFVGLTAGVSPSISFIENSGIGTNMGIVVNRYLETNVADVYAAGDCAEFENPQADHAPVEQLWYTGKMQGETLAKTLTGNRTAYQRGIWFNSAKFLDIEYQTYGTMLPQLGPEQESFYWEHTDGRKSFRATYNKDDRSLIGFNLLGLRFRQAIAEEWIRNRKPVDQCIRELSQGWFDPEFSKPYYRDILNAFLACTDFKPVSIN